MRTPPGCPGRNMRTGRHGRGPGHAAEAPPPVPERTPLPRTPGPFSYMARSPAPSHAAGPPPGRLRPRLVATADHDDVGQGLHRLHPRLVVRFGHPGDRGHPVLAGLSASSAMMGPRAPGTPPSTPRAGSGPPRSPDRAAAGPIRPTWRMAPSLPRAEPSAPCREGSCAHPAPRPARAPRTPRTPGIGRAEAPRRRLPTTAMFVVMGVCPRRVTAAIRIWIMGVSPGPPGRDSVEGAAGTSRCPGGGETQTSAHGDS